VQLVISVVFVFSDLAAPMNGLFVNSYHGLQQFNTWFKLRAADRKSPPEGLFTQVLPLIPYTYHAYYCMADILSHWGNKLGDYMLQKCCKKMSCA